MVKCVHKVSSPKTTIVLTEEKTKLGKFICRCDICLKEFVFSKLPEKLRS